MSTYPDLQGKVALVTGASSGIGFATAITLAEQGMDVAVHYFQNQKGAEDCAARITASGGRAITVRADVRIAAEVTALIDKVVSALGPIDVLVNNAGSLVERMKIRDLTEEGWDNVIDLNLKSAYLCSRAVAGSMMDRKRGTIINVASIAGRNGGGPGAIHYATAKGGLIAFTKALAKEMAGAGLRVNGIAPGVVWTPFHETFSTPEGLENFKKATPLGRLGKPEEVADTIAYLASERASFLVGETIEINGGLLMD